MKIKDAIRAYKLAKVAKEKGGYDKLSFGDYLRCCSKRERREFRSRQALSLINGLKQMGLDDTARKIEALNETT